MAPAVTKNRYPKRKRAIIDYDVEKSFVDVADSEGAGDGNESEDLGEEEPAIPASSHAASAASSAQPSNTVTVSVFEGDHDSEYEDATFGSRRKIKKVSLPCSLSSSSAWTSQLAC